MGKSVRCSAGKFRQIYLLLAGNDTVPISMTRGWVCVLPSAVVFLMKFARLCF